MLEMARASEAFLETPVFRAAAGLLADETQRMEWPAHTPGDIDHARFVPGDLVAGRYRIVGLLGRVTLQCRHCARNRAAAATSR
jgi:hypothetical protein